MFVEEGQMGNLLDADIDVYFFHDYEGQRDRLIIKMFYCTGMRLAELIGLRDCDVDCAKKMIKVTGKRNKQRLIPFADSLKNDILAYQRLRDESVAEHADRLFVLKSGAPLYAMAVQRVVKKYLEMVCTLDKKSPHVLRHSFATAMLNNGASLDAVRDLLGHANLGATQIYTHTTFQRLKEVYNKTHPRG